MLKEPVKIKELSPEQRTDNFSEVVLGYREEEALREASRCLQCKDPKRLYAGLFYYSSKK